MSELLEAVQIQPRSEVKAAVLWLHGLGADGHDFEPIVPELGIPDHLGVRFIFPHAPLRAVTINGGLRMRAWYDIKSLDLERHVEEADIEISRQQLEAWIAELRSSGIASEKIILAGFSQGGAVALVSGLRHQEPLGGILALSCYHPFAQRIAETAAEANLGVPIFMAHGSFDPVVPFGLAEASVTHLRANGYKVSWHSYSMQHSLCAEELVDIAAWLNERLTPL